MLNESAIQNPTKFQGPHLRRSGSTGRLNQSILAFPKSFYMALHSPGFKSWLVNINWAFVKPGSLGTANLSSTRLALTCTFSIVREENKCLQRVEDEMTSVSVVPTDDGPNEVGSSRRFLSQLTLVPRKEEVPINGSDSSRSAAPCLDERPFAFEEDRGRR